MTRSSWIVLLVANALACFADPPSVHGPGADDSTGTSGGSGTPTTGISAGPASATSATSEPVIDSSGESEGSDAGVTGPTVTTTADDDSTTTGNDDGPVTTASDDGPVTTASDDGPVTTASDDDGSSDGGSSSGEPPMWTCDPLYYGTNDGCDCGCGIFDPDCPDSTVDSCEYCGNPGSCSDDSCPSNIDPDDNATCTS
jgi:hypothetical protein